MKNWGEKKACLTLVYLLFIIPVCNWPEQYYLCTKQLLRVCQRLAGNLSAALAGADCQNFPKKWRRSVCDVTQSRCPVL